MNTRITALSLLLFFGISCGEQSTDSPAMTNECEPETARCVGELLERCGLDGTSSEPVSCPDGQYCAGNGGNAGCIAHQCGDGVIAGDEACDDGNDVNDDECTNECTLPRCGDGILSGDEMCDDGNDVNDDMCTNSCALPTCGDGIVTGDEACDDGNTIDDDACTNRCTVPSCGDGIITDDEECDDGNDVNGDECTNTCTLPICGDGIVNANEECDEGELNSDTVADTCRANCTLPACGDGVIDPIRGEACDDGNLDNGDACTSECIFASCGDGIVDGEEECDDGAGNSDTQADACRTNCTRARCGDEVQDAGEQCDDGADNGAVCAYGEMSCEVCSTTCQTETGDTSFCGDNREDAMAGEQCDDGNLMTELCAYGEMACLVCNDRCQTLAGDTAYCGDGTEDNAMRAGGVAEGCDNGPDNDDNRLCKSDCTPAVCGDGHRLSDITNSTDDRFEYCDDGNEVDLDDGCNSDCQLTERRENSTPPTPPTCQGFENEGRACSLNPTSGRANGECLAGKCLYTNPLPLLSANASGQTRDSLIHGRLTYNSRLTVNNRRDVDVFGFEQLCGYDTLEGNVGNGCTADNSAAYYFTVDYTGGGTNEPFTARTDCNTNGVCQTNLATFCTPESNTVVCAQRPAGKNRAYWCLRGTVVDNYRVWLSLETDATLDYTLTLREVKGSNACLYPTRPGPRP